MAEEMRLMVEAMPQMLKNLVLAPYSEESAKQIASAIILFYNELRKGGISDRFAERLTGLYVGTFRIPPGGAQVSYRGQ